MDDEGWEEVHDSTSLHDTCREMMHSLVDCQHPKDFLICMARTFGVLGESTFDSINEDYCRVERKGQVSEKDAFVTLRLCVEHLQKEEKDIVSWVRTWWYSNYFEEFASILLNGARATHMVSRAHVLFVLLRFKVNMQRLCQRWRTRKKDFPWTRIQKYFVGFTCAVQWICCGYCQRICPCQGSIKICY